MKPKFIDVRRAKVQIEVTQTGEDGLLLPWSVIVGPDLETPIKFTGADVRIRPAEPVSVTVTFNANDVEFVKVDQP